MASGNGGSANGGNQAGNTALVGGGNISGGNSTDARIVGGSSQNILGVNFTQTGGATATGGAVSNTGSASSTPTTGATLTGTNTQSQDQHPTQTGTTGGNLQDQTATSAQTAKNAQEAANKALGKVGQTANGGANTATAPTQTNPDYQSLGLTKQLRANRQAVGLE